MLSPKAADELLALSGMSRQQIEPLVTAAYRRQGYQLAEGAAARSNSDGGVLLMHGRQRVLLHCKHWRARKLSEAAVREMYGMMAAQDASAGILITCGTITLEASRFAGFGHIQLIDGQRLLALLRIAAVPSHAAEPAASGKSSAR
jgi:restriction system protein